METVADMVKRILESPPLDKSGERFQELARGRKPIPPPATERERIMWIPDFLQTQEEYDAWFKRACQELEAYDKAHSDNRGDGI